MNSALMSQILLAASSGAKEWPEDAQIYQPLPGQMSLYEHARCFGIEALLRLQNLKFDIVEKSNAEFISPSGKIPFLRMDDDVIGEESILPWLQTKGFSLIKDLPTEQKLQVKALLSLFERTLIPAELYCTWLSSKDLKEAKAIYGSVYSQPLKFILTRQKLASVKNFLKIIGWLDKSEEEVANELKTVFSVVSLKLQSNVFLVGDSPTEADALLFGHLQAVLHNMQSNKLLIRGLDNFPELVRYCVTVGKLCGFNAS